MPDDFATRSDLDGIGKRVSSIELKHEGCSAGVRERLKRVEGDIMTHDQEITRIFEAQEKISVNIEGMKATMKTWGLVAIIFAPIVGAVIGAVVGKVM